MTFGRDLIKSKLDNIPEMPGIYQMYNEKDQVIYIGKAKNLKKRLNNYLNKDLMTRTIKLISLIHKLEYTVANSEADALLLEAQLIKKFQPKYNVLLKDDKYFPYIKLNLNHNFPALLKYRGKNLTDGKFFGPFASATQLNDTIKELYKIFKIRSCTDSYFSNRTRPCLQYQINRCSAPCVGKISKEDYKESVNQLIDFLSGKTVKLQKTLSKKMEVLSENLEFEKAAKVRDKIKALSYTQLKSTTIIPNKNTDVISIASALGYYCIQVFTYRGGQFYGNKSVIKNSFLEDGNEEYSEILSSFIIQYYQTRQCPKEIITNYKLDNEKVIIDILKTLYNTNVTVKYPKHGKHLLLINHAYSNAKLALEEFIKNSAKNALLLKEVQELFGLDNNKPISRIEVFDNSHIMGSFPVSAMIVSTSFGFEKKEYRTFSVSTKSGDDYEILREVLKRRFLRLQKESYKTPDLIIIDGGKGHLSVASEVMKQFNINIPIVCMSKGPDRNAGLEQFHMINKASFTIDKNKPVMKYLQILRDEAHNFVIKYHRLKRSKNIRASSLDQVSGIGEKRKKALLNYFGSFEDIVNANTEDLLKVKGINKSVAEKIVQSLHNIS